MGGCDDNSATLRLSDGMVQLVTRQECDARRRVTDEMVEASVALRAIHANGARIALKAEMLRAIGGAYRPASAPARGTITYTATPPRHQGPSPPMVIIPEHDTVAPDPATAGRQQQFHDLLVRDTLQSLAAKSLKEQEKDCNHGVVGRLRALKRSVKTS